MYSFNKSVVILPDHEAVSDCLAIGSIWIKIENDFVAGIMPNGKIIKVSEECSEDQLELINEAFYICGVKQFDKSDWDAIEPQKISRAYMEYIEGDGAETLAGKINSILKLTA